MTQFELFLSIYIIFTGFVSSGVLGSFYQYWTMEPAGFSVKYDSWLKSFFGILFCIFAGPFIIMRNTLRGRKIEGRPLGWVVAASALATLWSFCIGVLILHTILMLRASISTLI